MRLEHHPILSFPTDKEVTFYYEGKEIEARKDETIAAALHAEGIAELCRSGDKHRSRGLFCAIGKCSSCLMKVDGVPNVRTCITMVRDGMEVEKQDGFPQLDPNTPSLDPGPVRSKPTDVLVVGGGPAGLKAALTAADAGAEVLLVDENPHLGGQLIKQTHKFFGSTDQAAGTRGVDIGKNLLQQVESHPKIESMKATSAVGIYGEIVGAYKNQEYFFTIEPQKIIVATGATEDMVKFPKNDLPGVYGAGGIQTLMNLYGIKPGEKVLMIGAGNVGLIVAYQLLQADVEVEAVVEIAPSIGGYFVHAAKLRRFGVPILTNHTVLKVDGDDRVEKVTVAELDCSGDIIPNSRKEYSVDVLALGVGLSPSYKLLHNAECDLKLSPELGGYVPSRNRRMKTSRENIFVAGDAAGIEEATSAILEGVIAGAAASLEIGRGGKKEQALISNSQKRLEELRAGPHSQAVKKGLQEVLQ
ncbi:MAG: FAD-dependent oxidoreductase [Candidatus Bipolaricaulota bacterium]